MKVELRNEVHGGLPPDDDHPYRTGVWRPQYREYDAWDLDVEGEIPDDLAGVYLRNTEQAVFEPVKRYHPFDGDGMVHSIGFANGEAKYANRFVRTEGFLAEQEAGRSLWAGITEHPRNAVADHGWGARSMMKDNASTDVIVHRGDVLASFYQCGELYRLDPHTLETKGTTEWGGFFPAEGVSAHPRVDEHTGELLFFNYGTEAPYMHYGVVSPEGELTNYVDIPLPGSRLPHDMMFTEHWTILNDLPLFWDPEALEAGFYSNTFRRDLPSRFALIPRHGTTEDIRWFEADPTFVLHWINAWEEGDEVILDGFFQENPTAWGVERHGKTDPRLKGFETLDMNVLAARPHRWRFNLATGECTEERLSDRCSEFPMINGQHWGRPYRYSYNARCAHGLFAFDGLIKHDVHAGTEELWAAPEGTFVSETVVAPKLDSAGEDDAYLVTFSSDIVNDESHCEVFDAADPAAGPIARVKLPERISSGTHATWAPASQLA
ncbi:MAG: carotenoid oxygenase family protein [Actinomycetota bacterium]